MSFVVEFEGSCRRHVHQSCGIDVGRPLGDLLMLVMAMMLHPFKPLTHQ